MFLSYLISGLFLSKSIYFTRSIVFSELAVYLEPNLILLIQSKIVLINRPNQNNRFNSWCKVNVFNQPTCFNFQVFVRVNLIEIVYFHDCPFSGLPSSYPRGFNFSEFFFIYFTSLLFFPLLRVGSCTISLSPITQLCKR